MATKSSFIVHIAGILFLCTAPCFAFVPHQQNQAQNDTTYIKQIISEAEIAVNHGQFDDASRNLKVAKRLSDSLDYLQGQALTALGLANVFLQQQKLDSAAIILNHAIQNYSQNVNLYNFHNLLGTVYNYKKQSEEALFHYRKSLDLIYRIPEDEQAKANASVRLNMADVFFSMGNQAEAFEHYLNAVRFSEMTRDTVLWVITLNNIGDTYNSINDHENASFYLEKAKVIAEKKNLKNELYRINLNLANARTEQERYEEARENYLTALKILKEIRPESPPVQVLYNLGKLNSKIGEYAEAEKNYRESLKYSEELNIAPGLWYNNYGLGSLFYDLGRLEESIHHLEIALKIAEQLQDVSFIQEARELLYKVYRDDGQFEKAFFQIETFHIASDSLFNIEKAQALATMENQLALDRQNEINRLLQEEQVNQKRRLQFQLALIITAGIIIILILVILVLMRKRDKELEEINEQLKQQKEELEEINQAKNRLFSIVAHDLRAPLTSLQGILYLIKDKVLSVKDVQELAQELEVSVGQNVETMEDLLAWANAQLSGVKMDIEPLKVEELVDDVLQNQSYMAQKKGLKLINEVANDCTVLGDKNALQLVFRNLVSNSIKFTPKGGGIVVSASSKPKNGRIQLSIKDTGIGIPPEDAGKVFSSKSWTRKGTENEKGTGFGLNLCRDFVDKMKGKIWFESDPGKGTTFFISLPEVSETDTIHQ